MELNPAFALVFRGDLGICRHGSILEDHLQFVRAGYPAPTGGSSLLCHQNKGGPNNW